jgi:hypothetical protein
LAVFAASAAAHRQAHANPLPEKLCSLTCTIGTIDCTQGGGSETFCAGFAAGCMIGCKISL